MLRCRDLAAQPGVSLWFVFALPICSSLDNLAVATEVEAFGLAPVSGALTFGVVSGGMALLGLEVNHIFGALNRFQARWLAGALLILVACGLVLKDAVLDLSASL